MRYVREADVIIIIININSYFTRTVPTDSRSSDRVP